MVNFQREGVLSNSKVGFSFENLALQVLSSRGLTLQRSFSLEIGVSAVKKRHSFDFGSKENKLVVECKSHKWTTGRNIPSAKLTTWDQAMYYFSLVPKEYRKIFFILKDTCDNRRESLASYYMRTHRHLIPSGVEFWEHSESANSTEILSCEFK